MSDISFAIRCFISLQRGCELGCFKKFWNLHILDMGNYIILLAAELKMGSDW